MILVKKIRTLNLLLMKTMSCLRSIWEMMTITWNQTITTMILTMTMIKKKITITFKTITKHLNNKINLTTTIINLTIKTNNKISNIRTINNNNRILINKIRSIIPAILNINHNPRIHIQIKFLSIKWHHKFLILIPKLKIIKRFLKTPISIPIQYNRTNSISNKKLITHIVISNKENNQ